MPKTILPTAGQTSVRHAAQTARRVAITPDELYAYIGVRPKFTSISDLKNAAWGAGQLTLNYQAYANGNQGLQELKT